MLWKLRKEKKKEKLIEDQIVGISAELEVEISQKSFSYLIKSH